MARVLDWDLGGLDSNPRPAMKVSRVTLGQSLSLSLICFTGFCKDKMGKERAIDATYKSIEERWDIEM